jgi:hypothetical protein
MIMAKKKEGRWTDKEVFEYIRAEASADNIVEETGISLGTLQKKVLMVQMEDGKVYNIKNIIQAARPIKFTKNRCIFITSPWLTDTDYEAGDEFSISLAKNKITLTKI